MGIGSALESGTDTPVDANSCSVQLSRGQRLGIHPTHLVLLHLLRSGHPFKLLPLPLPWEVTRGNTSRKPLWTCHTSGIAHFVFLLRPTLEVLLQQFMPKFVKFSNAKTRGTSVTARHLYYAEVFSYQSQLKQEFLVKYVILPINHRRAWTLANLAGKGKKHGKER